MSNWFKWYSEDWLKKRLRWHLSPAQRSIYIDICCLVNESQIWGVVATGEDQDGYIGYPIDWYTGQIECEVEDFQRTLEVLQSIDPPKVKVHEREYHGHNVLAISALNWHARQSEYNRQKGYRSKSELSDEDKKGIKGVFAGLKERRGTNSPKVAAETVAIKWCLGSGFTVEDMMCCYDEMCDEDFWKGKTLLMMSVKTRIGGWKKNKNDGSQKWNMR